MKKRRSPALWLLMIPAQLVLGGLFALLGFWLDSSMFSGGGQGHGIPVFSVLFPIIAASFTLFIILLSIILMAVGFSRRSRERQKAAEAAAAQRQQYGAYPPQSYPQQQQQPPYPPPSS